MIRGEQLTFKCSLFAVMNRNTSGQLQVQVVCTEGHECSVVTSILMKVFEVVSLCTEAALMNQTNIDVMA